jgi:hypothetical protein
MSDASVIAVANAVTTVLPSVVSLVRAFFVKQNPDLPPPTDAEILEGFTTTCVKSLAADDAWLASHPPTVP